MKIRHLFQCLFGSTLIMLLLISCQETETSNKDLEDLELGEIHIEVTCSENAIGVFKEGLLLLHSFQFDDAADKFLEAQKLDQNCAMAYWGEAMSKNHPLWREQEKDEALGILEKLGPDQESQAAMFKTDFEKDMYAAICILYGPGSKKENDKNYAAFMEALHQKYPEHHEVSAFYALSLLGAVEDGREESLYQKGAKIAQSIIKENPSHPGALHYLIHSYDDPENAHKALGAANSYAKIAPDAAHALHMPSHIYVALGMWDEVIKSNTAAVKASIERKERKQLDNKAIDFHSLKWLMYGHLQKGEYEEAKELVQQMETYCLDEFSPKAATHNVMMKAAYLTETQTWEDSLYYDEVDYSELPIQIYGTKCFMEGMKAYTNGDAKALEKIILKMDEPIAEAHKNVLMSASAMCSGSYNRKRPSKNHVLRTEVVQEQLRALVAMLQKDAASVEKYLQAAAKKEANTTFMYGPPEIVKPSHEMYAEWLSEQQRTEEALEHYKKVIERAPGRLIPTKAIAQLAKSS